MKWNPDSLKNQWVACSESAEKIRMMQEMSKTIFLALDGNGYGRTDIRMDKEGKLYVLEINPNCSIFYPDNNGSTADLILTLDGYGKKNFLKTMVEFAIMRHSKEQKNYVVKLNPSLGNGLYAGRRIVAGERIYQLEERPHVLVTKEHVQKTWNDRAKRDFQHFAYPLTDDLYVMWETDPDTWKPINHSCEPNAWVQGLDLYARVDIQRGEQITMDYATMYTENPVNFKCLCGSKSCRGTWKGDDYLQPWFVERYGDHVTDYVKQKRKGMQNKN